MYAERLRTSETGPSEDYISVKQFSRKHATIFFEDEPGKPYLSSSAEAARSTFPKGLVAGEPMTGPDCHTTDALFGLCKLEGPAGGAGGGLLFDVETAANAPTARPAANMPA